LLKNIPGTDFILALDTFLVAVPAFWAAKVFRKKILIRTGGDFLWEQYIERIGPKVLLSDFYKSSPKLVLKEKIIFYLTGATLRGLSGVIFSTKYQEDIFSEAYGLDKDKNYRIENYYGEKRTGSKPKEKNFLLMGRNIQFKNLKRIKRAFNLAKKERSEIKLEIGSDLLQQELFEKIKNCYAVVNVSIGEISPNFILEAITFNKPFILTEENGLKDRINSLAVSVNPMNIESIKNGIISLSKSDIYKEKKQKIENFKFTHSYKEIAEEFVTISEKI
jgi:glycosyltransferase involved in cell wall biosynthesis